MFENFERIEAFDDSLKRGSWLWWLVGFYLTLPITVYIILPFLTYKGSAGKRKTISILVLGDVGHSPRMCYHARSFSELDYNVNLCGYVETEPPTAVIDDINIEIHPIHAIQNTMELPYLAFAVQKVLMQLVQLGRLLFELRGSHYFMIQNPPSLPLLLLVVVFIKLFSRNSLLIIDWHNLNYTILNLKFKNMSHPMVRLLRLYEKYLGRCAWLNLTVTNQMKQFLVTEFQLNPRKIIVLHDRPARQFVPLIDGNNEKQEILSNHELFQGIKNIQDYRIIVSATSFTPDEDFEILLRALKTYDDNKSNIAPLLLIITGKGPLKQMFLDRVDSLDFSPKVIVKTAWLSSEDYPKILSLADLAVSLHTSSSGIDLPMKIVDFFGVGVPVITLDFPAIGELVKDQVNGMVTHTTEKSDEADQMYKLITKAMSDPQLLSTLKENAIEESKNTWDINWRTHLEKVFYYGD
ncbi:putative chitobiosyldiphosphodolichol beta-mannosyltransferase [Clavispora lusitaniae]|uniref:Chitobiosyldiphosphodolichol beta-mannosyltransferase n=1 Tax=Clavispora lusitaniae TaxID=36911 RepID=A0ACD0WG07_CLALS|nr:putative chitobiosyldiphosphodolichol beta-mannosyltransferase [Clavispora lusitaniae]QFZ31886.1 putative chitobiosyldiphosphodolichol beta-mannosyltransferase [Clavispora lusitaniae]QFZ37555.1 putative chitobiosyldiphosphodolichol beta-mannosyltransferase [Clavispora lusitaniae]QFZ43239.1 putative chitobiosyldiphosphodolichol beta-mannosyltransferase [Clavispora lusitaniae]QFZ48915.1 putative chitobiosyldiphosphodolichol beta-mannosyltransferase [Clavispora lusitaniae]